jgi:hypothetical protein
MTHESGVNLIIFITVINSLISLIVSLIALNLSRSNKKTVRTEFKFQLFEKRHEVFISTWRFMSDLLQKDPVTALDILNFSNATANAKFLFESNVVDFINEVKAKGIRLGTAEYSLARPSTDEIRLQMSEERHKIVSWVETEIVTLTDRFKPYLDVSDCY